MEEETRQRYEARLNELFEGDSFLSFDRRKIVVEFFGIDKIKSMRLLYRA